MARAAIARGERVIRDFADRVCKRCSSLVSAQSTTHRDRLNAVLTDGQPKDAYLGGFHVKVLENGHALHIVNADSKEERGGRTPPLGADGDDSEVVPPAAEPS